MFEDWCWVIALLDLGGAGWALSSAAWVQAMWDGTMTVFMIWGAMDERRERLGGGGVAGGCAASPEEDE